jgi:hypothetical protein
MVDEREIWACANFLLQRHGADAAGIAEARADALGAEGAAGGQRIFRLIADRVGALGKLHTDGPAH